MTCEQAQTWNHAVKGVITGVEVGGDDVWMKVRLVGDHKLRWLSPGRAQRGEVTPDGTVGTYRRCRMVPVSPSDAEATVPPVADPSTGTDSVDTPTSAGSATDEGAQVGRAIANWALDRWPNLSPSTLTEEVDWTETAQWCGGTIETTSCPSGEYTSVIRLPSGDVAAEGEWITLGHDGQFRARWSIEQPTISAAFGRCNSMSSLRPEARCVEAAGHVGIHHNGPDVDRATVLWADPRADDGEILHTATEQPWCTPHPDAQAVDQ